MGHDLIVIGASAGGVEALKTLLAALPADLPACVCIVQHLSSNRESYLPRVLNHTATLTAHFAADGDPIEHGRVYVAPRDRHLIVDAKTLQVVMGPRENNFRPAVDPLFRSAALAHGERVVGVVLSGALDCGTAGLLAIKRRGGVALVQDPTEALVNDMPRSAIDNVAVDAVLPLRALAERLVELSRTPVRKKPRPRTLDVDLERELKMDRMEPDPDLMRPSGPPAGLTCPHCTGPLFEVTDGPPLQFRCRVGHSFGGKALTLEQQNATEGAFWAALRALEEQAALAERMAARAHGQGHKRSAASFDERARSAALQARIVREELLRKLEPPSDSDHDEDEDDERGRVKH